MTTAESLSERLGSLLSFLPIEELPEARTEDLMAAPVLSVSPRIHSNSPPRLPKSHPSRLKKPKVASLSIEHKAKPPLKREPTPQRSKLSDSEKMKLKNHHQLMRTMVKMEDEEGEVKRSSLLNQSFARMQKGMRDIRITANAKLPKIAPIKLSTISNFALNPHEAHYVLSESERTVWMRRRGIEAGLSGARSLVNFVKELFEVLDDSGVGSIDQVSFTESMLSLGLCPDAMWMRRALETLHLARGKVYKNELISALKKDIRNFTFFRILERESGYSPAPLPYPKPSLQSAHQSSAQILLHTSQSFSAYSPTLNRISACVSTIDRWWRELDIYNIGLANVNRTSEFFVLKQLAGNKYEGKNLLEEVRPLQDSASINKDHFVRVFAPAVFFGAMSSLEGELNTGEFASMPFKVKIATFQRKLLLAGVVSRPSDKHRSPGKAIVEAISSFRKETQGDGRTSKADSVRMSLDGGESLNLSQLDEDPTLGGEERRRMADIGQVQGLIQHKRSQSELKTPVRPDETPGKEAVRHRIHGKVFFPSIRKLPRPRDVQIPRENFILEKYERAMELKNEGEELFHA